MEHRPKGELLKEDKEVGFLVGKNMQRTKLLEQAQ